MQSEGTITIGKIVAAHGIKGAVKVYSYAESLSIFKPRHAILLEDSKGRKETRIIDWVRPHKQGAILAFAGIATRSGAEGLIGSVLFVQKGELPDLDEGDYYWTDIIGLSVYQKDGTYLGKVTSILPTGSNDVYVVKDRDDGEILIPALESVVTDIDLEHRKMQVQLPEGLE